MLELREKLVVVGDEIFGDLLGDFVEAPQGNFVGSAECARQRLQRFLNFFRRASLQVIVNQNGRRQGKRIRGKQRDRLLDAVFKNPEVVLLRDRSPVRPRCS